MMIPLPLSQHQANRSPFERFLMTTTAQDGSFKAKNISAPFLRPWAEKKRVIIRVPQNSQQPPSSKFKAESRDWWAATCCQNYKLPHSSRLVLAHDIFIRHIISHKNQPKVEVKFQQKGKHFNFAVSIYAPYFWMAGFGSLSEGLGLGCLFTGAFSIFICIQYIRRILVGGNVY